MTSFKRRRLLAGLGAAAIGGSVAWPVRAIMGPNDKFDLVYNSPFSVR